MVQSATLAKSGSSSIKSSMLLPCGTTIIPFQVYPITIIENICPYKSFYNNIHRSIYNSQKVETTQMYIKMKEKICPPLPPPPCLSSHMFPAGLFLFLSFSIIPPFSLPLPLLQVPVLFPSPTINLSYTRYVTWCDFSGEYLGMCPSGTILLLSLLHFSS